RAIPSAITAPTGRIGSRTSFVWEARRSIMPALGAGEHAPAPDVSPEKTVNWNSRVAACFLAPKFYGPAAMALSDGPAASGRFCQVLKSVDRWRLPPQERQNASGPSRAQASAP